VEIPTEEQQTDANGHTERNASSNTSSLQSKELALHQTNPQMKLIRDPENLMRLRLTCLTTKYCLRPPTLSWIESKPLLKKHRLFIKNFHTAPTIKQSR
jgi:hypothetical protein